MWHSQVVRTLCNFSQLKNVRELKLQGIDYPLTLADIYRHLVEGILDKLEVVKDQSKKISAQYHFVFITVPTNTHEDVQKLIRNCVFRALETKMKTLPPKKEHIYIVEESILISYNDTVLSPNSLLCDLGFLSLDIAVIKDGVIIDHQAEIAGVEILHRTLDRELRASNINLNSKIVLNEMFSNPDAKWNDYFKGKKEVIGLVKSACKEAFSIILSPLFECLADYPFDVVLHGAIFSIDVFKQFATKFLCKSNMSKYLKERKRYFSKVKTPADFKVSTLGTSFGLLNGAVELIRDEASKKKYLWNFKPNFFLDNLWQESLPMLKYQKAQKCNTVSHLKSVVFK
ncbi:hypothetical protein FDP41_005178 [Naegleria fowleri]|uniref:Uncharacterized protein n=1 Tax=Naegleria fowleri TaxID=5763 RepID=A0A6A5BNJ5_NAEFO|nr:uncharacterized protein FDP41_005178 [Naegleria fowleri]KAF0975851.1 hypothetical protein FDP41_005178 [Naegleria fowleri]